MELNCSHVAIPIPVPNRHDPDASLETVDLNEDESGLETFLANEDVYDVSPLPRDEDGNASTPDDDVTVPTLMVNQVRAPISID